MRTHPTPPLALPLMTLVLLLFVGLVGRHLTIDPIWYDEHRSFFYAGWDAPGHIAPGAAVQRVRESDVQAPGYFVALNVWGRALGQHVYAARLLSLLLGTLALAAVYRLAADLSAWRGGVAAAVMLGTSAFYVTYAHETRTYAALVLFVALALLGYWRLRNRLTWAWGGLLVVSMAALPYLHYLAALIFPVLGLYHLLNFRQTRHYAAVFGLMALAGVLFLPWAAVAAQATMARATVIRSTVPTMGFIEILTTTAAEFSNGNIALLLVLLAVSVSARRREARYIAVTGVLMLVCVYLFDRVIPVLNHSRYLIVLWAFVAVLAGLGVEQLGRVGLPAVLILVVWGGLGVIRSVDADYRLNINGPGAFAAWDAAAQLLPERVQPGDLIALHLPYSTLYDPYHAPIADYYLGDVPVQTTGVESLPVQPDADYLREALSRVQDAERVWYFRDTDQLPEMHGLFDRAIAEELAPCGSIAVPDGYALDLFIQPPAADAAVMQFGDGIRMVPTVDLEAIHGEQLYLTSGWLVADDVPPHTYSVALHLLDANGNLVLQADYGLPPAGARCGYGPFDLSALAGGTYTVTVGVYAWESGERLIGQTIAGAQRGERLPLGQITRR